VEIAPRTKTHEQRLEEIRYLKSMLNENDWLAHACDKTELHRVAAATNASRDRAIRVPALELHHSVHGTNGIRSLHSYQCFVPFQPDPGRSRACGPQDLRGACTLRKPITGRLGDCCHSPLAATSRRHQPMRCTPVASFAPRRC